VLDWTLNYDPAGKGTITAVIGNASVGHQTMVAALEPGHRLDGAAFNHFGLPQRQQELRRPRPSLDR